MHLHCLYVGHFAGNLGDSAMFEALESLLPADARVTCEAHTLRPWPGERTRLIPHDDLRACDDALTAADAAILPGTTIVTDLHGGEWPIVPILERCWRAMELGRPIHAVGVGVYPSAAWQRRRIASELIPLVESFSVRDAASRDALLAAGAAPERVTLTADLAFLLPSPRRPASGSGPPTVGVNVVHEDWREREAFYRGVAEELDAFAAESGCRLRLMCNEIRDGEMFDGAAAQALAARLRGPVELSPPAWRSPREVIAELAGCELAVSMRYHYSIFAAIAGTPWVGFARGGKMRALCEEFGAPPAADMGEAPGGRLLAALREAWSQRDARRAAMERVMSALRERAARCGEALRAGMSRDAMTSELARRSRTGSRAWDLARRGKGYGGPPFLRCTSEEGITPAEGPHPQFDLPVVRWGLGPQSVLRFQASGTAAVLRIEARRNDDPHQAIELWLNGRFLARHQFGPDAVFHELYLPVQLCGGENELRIEYQSWGSREDARELAVLFRRIQIVPR